jgi:hypothetical protein
MIFEMMGSYVDKGQSEPRERRKKNRIPAIVDVSLPQCLEEGRRLTWFDWDQAYQYAM